MGYRFVLVSILLCIVWMNEVQAQVVTFSTLEKKMQEQPKPIVIFLHTNWCTYCSLMKKKTFSNVEVQEVLSEKVYFISLDAETKEKIQFRGKEFVYRKKGLQSGINELAKVLASKNVYPAVVVLNKSYEIIYQHYAYVGPKEMLQLLNVL